MTNDRCLTFSEAGRSHRGWRHRTLAFDIDSSDAEKNWVLMSTKAIFVRRVRLFEKAFNPNLENVFGEISKHRISESRGHWLTLGLTRNARLPLHGIAQAREARTANGIAGAAWLLIWRDKELLPRGNERLAFVKYRKSLANQFYVLVANRWIVFFRRQVGALSCLRIGMPIGRLEVHNQPRPPVLALMRQARILFSINFSPSPLFMLLETMMKKISRRMAWSTPR